MFKKIFFLGICAGIFSAVACLVLYRIYVFAFEINFSRLINIGSLVVFNLSGCLLAVFGYWFVKTKFPAKADIIFNLVFTLLSFASIILPISISLPTDIPNPEFFPGLAVPMHFFPAIGWYTLKPMFFKG